MVNNRILIVEGEGIVAKDLQGILEGRGYRIPSIVNSGEEAIEKAKNACPDLILMDIRLKGSIDGIEASREIHNNLDIPIIYITVYTDERTLERVRATKPFGYLLKPFNEVELCMAVQTALQTHQLQQETQKKLEEAQHLSEIGVCAATIAHELRNPLGTMKMSLFNIKQKNKDPSLDSHLEHIEQKILESERVITDLLNYSQTKTPQYQAISIMDILDECIVSCQNRHPQWNVEIQKRYDCEKNDSIEADSLYITQLFCNILNNAFQAFPNKEGRLTIELNYQQEKNYCRVVFQDNGIGIAEADLPKIFDPFFTTKPKGIGLGLSICQQLVDLHGGKVSINSLIGAGTELYIQLPIKANQ